MKTNIKVKQMSYTDKLEHFIIKTIVNKLYQRQVINSLKRKMGKPKYTKNQLHDWVLKQKNVKKLLKNWINSGEDVDLTLSIDRLDSTKTYSFDNIELVPWKINRNRWYSEVKKLKRRKHDYVEKIINLQKPVFQFNLKGELVDKFDMISEAEEKTNIPRANIARSIKSKKLLAGGYIWLTVSTNGLDADLKEFKSNLKNGDPRSLKVLKIDFDGNIVKEYDKLNDVVKDGYNKGNVGMACTGKRTSAYGYIWAYDKDFTSELLDSRLMGINKNAIVKLDTKNNVLEKFYSIHDAERKTGISVSSIHSVINGRRKSAGGYVWRKLANLG